jgi:hypothetical protein
MEAPKNCIEIVISILKSCGGVHKLKILTEKEKKRISQLEEKAEEEIAYALCKTLNIGLREAMKREFTIAILIDSSVYLYPHHPDMVMLYDDVILGEQVHDPIRIGELRKDRKNFFLWDNFVIYTKRLPKDKNTREKIRLIYKPMNVKQLENIPCVKEQVFGTPSVQGDVFIKKILNYSETSSIIGTNLIGFNAR